MPRKRRKERARRDLTDEERHENLLHCLHGCGIKTRVLPEASLRELWIAVRREVLDEWIREYPGTRPWAWWRFDMPEGTRREVLDGGTHPFDCPRRRAHVRELVVDAGAATDFERAAYALYRGKPKMVFRFERLREYESEAEYLRRLDLLKNAEERELYERGTCRADDVD